MIKPFSDYVSYNGFYEDKISNFPWINLKLVTALLKDLNTKLPYTTVTGRDFSLAGLTNSVKTIKVYNLYTLAKYKKNIVMYVLQTVVTLLNFKYGLTHWIIVISGMFGAILYN